MILGWGPIEPVKLITVRVKKTRNVQVVDAGGSGEAILDNNVS